MLIPGHCVAQLRLVFLVATPKGGRPLQGLEKFFAYVERFDIVPQSTGVSSTRAAVPDPVSGMYLLKCAYRADGCRFGDIIPLAQLRGPIELLPSFGKAADTCLTMQNSLEYSKEFLLNRYSDKEVFWALLH